MINQTAIKRKHLLAEIVRAIKAYRWSEAAAKLKELAALPASTH